MSDVESLLMDLEEMRRRLVRRSIKLSSTILFMVSATALVEQIGLITGNRLLLVWVPTIVDAVMAMLSLGLMRKYVFLYRFLSMMNHEYRGKLRSRFSIYVGEIAAYFIIGYLLSRVSLPLTLATEMLLIPIILRLPAKELISKVDRLLLIYAASFPIYFLLPEWSLSVAGALLLMGGIYIAHR